MYKRQLQPSAVKQVALRHGIAVAQPHSLRLDGKYPDEAEAARQAIAATGADVMVVAAYGLILPQWTLDAPRRGCLNIHASLLPRWRGAAPIHRAIEAGDTQTGITIMQMDAGLDTGDMLLVEDEPVTAHDTTATLHDRLAALGGRLIVQALAQAAQGPLHATPQPEAGVTYAHKIDKREAAIDWHLPAAQIERRIRAFDPFPGATTQSGDESIKVWQAETADAQARAAAQAGEVLEATPDGILVACGPEGRQTLRLRVLQRAGGKRLAAGDFLRGHALPVGGVLGSSTSRET